MYCEIAMIECWIFGRYLRLKVPETTGLIIDSSEERLSVLKKYGHPINKKDVIDMLSDQTGKNYRVFQESGNEDYVKTIAVGKLKT